MAGVEGLVVVFVEEGVLAAPLPPLLLGLNPLFPLKPPRPPLYPRPRPRIAATAGFSKSVDSASAAAFSAFIAATAGVSDL